MNIPPVAAPRKRSRERTILIVFVASLVFLLAVGVLGTIVHSFYTAKEMLFMFGVGPPRVVKGDPEYPTDYVIGSVYTLQQDIDVLPGNSGPSTWDLNLQKGSTPATRIGRLPKGTRLKFLNIISKEHISVGLRVVPSFEILDGPLAGKHVIGESISSNHGHSNERLFIDPPFLK